MNQHGEDNADATGERDELGISTGLLEWFETAPWVIKGRLVARTDRKNQSLNTLSGYQVELPSRRWLVGEISPPENEEASAIEPAAPDRPAEPPLGE